MTVCVAEDRDSQIQNMKSLDLVTRTQQGGLIIAHIMRLGSGLGGGVGHGSSEFSENGEYCLES